MFDLIGFGSLSAGEFWGALMLVSVASLVLGSMTDAVMKDAGFGVVGNAILCLLGGFIGAISYQAYARTLALHVVQRSEMAVMISVSMIMATTVLLMLALLKRFAMR